MTTYQRFVSLFSAALLVFSLTAKAQIVNGSFEEDSTFTTAGWQFPNVPDTSDDCRTPLSDTPPGGGQWSLRLPVRNYQGQEDCFTVAFQTIPGATSGEIWRATAWARVPPEREAPLPARLYWTTFEPGQDSGFVPAKVYFPGPYGSTADTDSREWTLLTVTDTLFLAPGDSVGVVLDGGATTGPMLEGHWAAFDLVMAERIGSMGTGVPAPPATFALLPPRPSSFRSSTEIRFKTAGPSEASLVVYDALGREVARLVNGALGAGEHRVRLDGADLPPGVYLLRLTSGGRAATQTLVRLG